MFYLVELSNGIVCRIFADSPKKACSKVEEIVKGEFDVTAIAADPLFINPRWLLVDGLCAVDGSWEIELPSPSRFKAWGDAFHYCLPLHEPTQFSSVVFAVKVGGKVKHIVEMRLRTWEAKVWYCNQFSGEYGGEYPCRHLKYKVLLALYRAGLSSSAFVAECGSIVHFVELAKRWGL